ncbi:hypothetical protein ES708_21469 [subsurface metagenome]
MSKLDSPVGLLPLENAIGLLTEYGFTIEEAKEFIAASDTAKRLEISQKVIHRLKGGTTS